MLLFYIVTAFKTEPFLVVLVVVSNILVQMFLLVVGLTDAGMIPKILSTYENKKLKRLPID